ncbi:hypothetical protein F0562_015318 [Nyssa sinensis]|uniref:Uncharacterized protein n=1 Tax=Nyssa sinensis TaxID=561372 RepID=A0A5J4ZJ50_9ASTE|nr:hypothetical protein F0562_015318 [Nyssa sinensis]
MRWSYRQRKEQVIGGLGYQWNWLKELQLGATELELLEQQLRISEQLPDQVTSGFQYLVDGLALPAFTISSVFMLTLWSLVTTVATGSGGLATTKISEGESKIRNYVKYAQSFSILGLCCGGGFTDLRITERIEDEIEGLMW